MSSKLEERAKYSGEVWRLMAILEHELDWGICGDTVSACAQNARVAKAIEAFFDAYCDDATVAIAIARDRLQNLCDRHLSK